MEWQFHLCSHLHGICSTIGGLYNDLDILLDQLLDMGGSKWSSSLPNRLILSPDGNNATLGNGKYGNIIIKIA